MNLNRVSKTYLATLLITVYRLSGRAKSGGRVNLFCQNIRGFAATSSERALSLESLDASWRAVGNSSHFTWNDPILGFPLSRELVAQQELHVLTYT